MTDILGMIIGTVVTLVIFSYLLGDNVLYRWALALLVGAAIGYATGVAVDFVWGEWVINALSGSDPATNIARAIPLLLGGLLLLRGFPPKRFFGRLANLGRIPLGLLVGVGAGVAVSGALTGTLLPQVLATGQALILSPGIDLTTGLIPLLQGLVTLIGTVAVLLLFRARPKTQEPDMQPSTLRVFANRLGGFFLVVGLGAAFAGAISSALTAMVIRLGQISDLITRLLSSVGG